MTTRFVPVAGNIRQTIEALQRRSNEAKLIALLSTAPSIRIRTFEAADKWQQALCRFVDRRTIEKPNWRD